MITHPPVIAGSVDQSVTIRALNTDGTPKTDFAFNSAGIDLKYHRTRSAPVNIAEVTLAADNTAHTDGGVKHFGNGYVRVDLPDAAFVAGASAVEVIGTADDTIIVGAIVPIISGAYGLPSVHAAAIAESGLLDGDGSEDDPVTPA